MVMLLFVVGVASWTLAEYLLHRFLGHEHRGRNFFKAEHTLHHSRANYFAPAYKKVLLAVTVSLVLLLTLNLLLPFAWALALLRALRLCMAYTNLPTTATIVKNP